MTPWLNRAPEERALLNPCYLSLLLWGAATGYTAESGVGLPFGMAFLVNPLVLHRETRESLPIKVTTSLAVWLEDHQITRARGAERARALASFTKEALMFGGVRGLLRLKDVQISAEPDWKKPIAAELAKSSDEVSSCSKKAEFLGRWFARAGSPATVMALLGVRP